MGRGGTLSGNVNLFALHRRRSRQVQDLLISLLAVTVIKKFGYKQSGLPVARDMDGRPAPFLELPTREPVASYDTTPIERIGELDSPAEQVILERLRALGYIE